VPPRVKRLAVHALLIAAVLGAIATSTPAPLSDDRDTYQQVGRHVLIRDCSNIHCFRILVAVALEPLPGPSLVKWKAYAVLANAAAALAVGHFCLLVGLSAPAAVAASWISALGSGSLYSLFDSYTSDPLMYLIGPLVAIAVWQGRVGRAGVISGIGVFAKEFAAAPLWMFTIVAALERNWRLASRLLAAAVAASLIWLFLQLGLRMMLNYTNGATASSNLLHGAYLALWLRNVGVVNALKYLFLTFGALYLLLPAGLASDRMSLHLMLASLPAVAAFMYVQQPERALWNFHFIVIPIAVRVLQELPEWAMRLFAAAFGVANLRFAAQLPLRTTAKAALAVSVAIACGAVVVWWSRGSERQLTPPAPALP
jgi:hypothetical protein